MKAATASHESASVRTSWPADHFYWTVLDAPPGARVRSGPLPIGLRAAFEADVPETHVEDAGEPADSGRGLHAVCISAGKGKVIVCAASVGRLGALDAQARALTPGEVPAFIHNEVAGRGGEGGATPQSPDVIAASLNLLVGEFEPAPWKAARARRSVLAMATVLLCCVLAAIGLLRRGVHDLTFASAALTQADESAQRLGQSLRIGVRVTPDTLPALLAVTRRSAEAAARISPPGDASVALAELLERWPRDDGARGTDAPAGGRWECTVQSLSASGDSIAISVTVDGDTSEFLRTFSPPEGWTIDEPRLTGVGRAAVPGRPIAALVPDGAASAAALTRIGLTLRRGARLLTREAGGVR